MQYLIGNSGLVGKNLIDQIKFDYTFNSSNIGEFDSLYQENSDLYLSCLPATKWMINKNIPKDIENINNILNVIKGKQYNRIILISTIDVYSDSEESSDESQVPVIKNLNYGSNRYLFELFVSQILNFEKLYIFRLPALFGKYLKKNILFDLLNDNNVQDINPNTYFQWYNLNNLSCDMDSMINRFPEERIFNLFPEPIYTKDILDTFFPNVEIKNSKPMVRYNFKTKFSDIGYFNTKENSIKEIGEFVNGFSNQ
jgi:hypothetical protein